MASAVAHPDALRQLRDGSYNIRPSDSSSFHGMANASRELMAREQDERISRAVEEERSRLGRFIQRRVPDPSDAEDILQEVFSELVEATRLLMPIEHLSGWLFQVARNRITDLFRKKKPELLGDLGRANEEGTPDLEELLPSPEDGPEALYARKVILEELEWAIGELPEEQRQVFVLHELEGLSFKEIARKTGVGINTLLSRKRYAVRRLRGSLQAMHDEIMKGSVT